MNNFKRKFLALLLAVIQLFALCSIEAFAADDPTPPAGLKGIAGRPLSTVSLGENTGWAWDNPSETITAGSKTYSASYTNANNTSVAAPEFNDVTVDISVEGEKTTLTSSMFTVSSKATYNAAVQMPTITVNDSYITSSDYTISYSSSEIKNAGNYTVTISGQNNYQGELEYNYEIEKYNPPVPKNLTALLGQKLSDITLPEYLPFGKWEWISDSDTVLSDTGSKTFKAKFSTGDSNVIAHPDETLTVTVSSTGNVTVVAPTFTNAEFEYDSIDAKEISITNKTGMAISIDNVSLDFKLFTVSSGSSSVGNNITDKSYKIAPNDDLTVGTYKSVITVDYTTHTGVKGKATANVTFTVVPRKMELTATPDTIGLDDLKAGPVSVIIDAGTAVIAKMELSSKPSGYVRDSVYMSGYSALFMENAVIGTYTFKITPNDTTLYKDGGTVSVKVINGSAQLDVAKTPAQISTAISGAKWKGAIDIQGVTLISKDQVYLASQKSLTLNVKVDNTFSWKVNTNDVPDNKALLDLSVKTLTVSASDINKAVFGTVDKTLGFTTKETNLGKSTVLTVNVGTRSSDSRPMFANLYKYDAKNNLEFVKAYAITKGGTVDLPIDTAGKFVIAASAETKLLGDMDNSCGLNAKDATAMLKLIAGSKGLNKSKAPKVDYNGDGKTNAKDATALLKDIAAGKIKN